MSFNQLTTSSSISILLLIVLPLIMNLLFFLIDIVSGEGIGEWWAPIVVSVYGMFLFVRYNFPAPLVDKPEKYFQKFGLEDIVSEYEFSRKLFYITIAIFIPLTIIGLYPLDRGSYLWYISYYITTALYIPIIFSSSRVRLYLRKDFYYYLAKAYFKISSKKEVELEKFRYLFLTLSAYNKFLEKNINLRLDDLQIRSLIISERADQKNSIRESIDDALNHNNKDDKFELVRKLAESRHLSNKDKLLVGESAILNQQFKEVLTVIIPAVIAIIGFIVTMLNQAGILASPP